MKLKTFIIKGLSKAYKMIFNPTYYDCMKDCKSERQECNDVIFNALENGNPFMLSRYGSIEMIVTNSIRIKEQKKCYAAKLWDYISDKTDLPWMDERVPLFISRNAGVFNPTPEILERFAHLYLEDSNFIDILLSINYKEKFMPLRQDCQFIHLESAYPFFVDKPWTRALKGKKVLVVHPFSESIKKQYAKRNKLFANSDILPEFELKTIKAVQSAAYSKVPFQDWFDALDFMKNQIESVDFYVCLIGCGAYGLPLAAHVKRMGKQAIHLGGGLQLLFGIKGRRWEVEYKCLAEKGDSGYNVPFKLNINYYDLFNEYWINPLKEEIPKESKTIEEGCYW